jgi:HD-GYP domain-containing protein (c-di-GMP phosphodiesterase class II)
MSTQPDKLKSDSVTIYKEIFDSILNCKNEYIQFHSIRVVLLAEELGHACNLADDDMRKLKVSSFFHDIGKIHIPDHILQKPGKLDDHEWEIMKQHPQYGQCIIDKLNVPYGNEVSLYIRHHHEFWDGSGYPDQLSRDKIPFVSRIISLVDSYDAITETRPYRKTLRHDQALEIMQREVGTKFDPYLSKLFFKTINDLISTNDSL